MVSERRLLPSCLSMEIIGCSVVALAMFAVLERIVTICHLLLEVS
jgi:hypothetical protein